MFFILYLNLNFTFKDVEETNDHVKIDGTHENETKDVVVLGKACIRK